MIKHRHRQAKERARSSQLGFASRRCGCRLPARPHWTCCLWLGILFEREEKKKTSWDTPPGHTPVKSSLPLEAPTLHLLLLFQPQPPPYSPGPLRVLGSSQTGPSCLYSPQSPHMALRFSTRVSFVVQLLTSPPSFLVGPLHTSRTT